MQIITRSWRQILSREVFWSATAVLVYLALAKLIIHLLTANNYGYMVDEFYWLAMGRHLDFGYVDVPPLVAYIGAVWQLLFGTSLFAIRILPALAGAAMVFFAGLLAREMGGGRFSQSVAALLILVTPFWLGVSSVFHYDSFEQLWAIILFYLISRLIKEETPRRWIGLGIMAGLGIMTKLTMIPTVGALVLSLLASPGLKNSGTLSPLRKSLMTKWPWLAAGIVILLCMPYTIWQWVRGFPLITYWRDYTFNRMRIGSSPGLLQFFGDLLMSLNPIMFPLLLLGLCYLFFHPEGKKYRSLGLAFLVLLIFYGYQLLNPRMLVSACFPLVAAGAVWLEKIIGAASSVRAHRARMKGTFRLTPWLVQVYLGMILIVSVLLAPLALPLLPADVLEKYIAAAPPFYRESLISQGTEIPFHFALRFGWPELVQKVAEVYHRLPVSEREYCTIWAQFYWQAGPIDLLGKKYGLPDAISTHLSYYFWGPDPERRGVDPEVVIFLGLDGRIPRMAFDEVIPADFLMGNPLGTRLARYLQVYVCRKPKRPLKEIWPSLVSFN